MVSTCWSDMNHVVDSHSPLTSITPSLIVDVLLENSLNEAKVIEENTLHFYLCYTITHHLPQSIMSKTDIATWWKRNASGISKIEIGWSLSLTRALFHLQNRSLLLCKLWNQKPVTSLEDNMNSLFSAMLLWRFMLLIQLVIETVMVMSLSIC